MKSIFILCAATTSLFLGSCKRNFTCTCEITLETCNYEYLDYTEIAVVEARTKHEAFNKCHALDNYYYGDCPTDAYVYKNVWCNSN